MSNLNKKAWENWHKESELGRNEISNDDIVALRVALELHKKSLEDKGKKDKGEKTSAEMLTACACGGAVIIGAMSSFGMLTIPLATISTYLAYSGYGILGCIFGGLTIDVIKDMIRDIKVYRINEEIKELDELEFDSKYNPHANQVLSITKKEK